MQVVTAAMDSGAPAKVAAWLGAHHLWQPSQTGQAITPWVMDDATLERVFPKAAQEEELDLPTTLAIDGKGHVLASSGGALNWNGPGCAVDLALPSAANPHHHAKAMP
ncbi:hypothetical protein E3E12_00450 [Formicincola oecophyllae]|uniref:Uncharacterized protein n=1 Tax=Formicincola oecophyllae TaxID=2558361 RepID=A0A4Y6U6Y8_9PROT|nr:hypothetical protein [Formicincola oecophyllae]QDH12924.1 hypothetical protein E3E12_00450 [Formicincola oecophyllae]